MSNQEKIDELSSDVKLVIRQLNNLNLAFEINKVKNEKIPLRVDKLEKGQAEIKSQIAEIKGFFKYSRIFFYFISALLGYFGIRLGLKN